MEINGFGLGWVEILVLVPALAILLWALIDVATRPASRIRHLPRWGWVLIVLFGNTLGQVVYLVIGRDTTKAAVDVAPSVSAAQRGSDAADMLYGARDAQVPSADGDAS